MVDLQKTSDVLAYAPSGWGHNVARGLGDSTVLYCQLRKRELCGFLLLNLLPSQRSLSRVNPRRFTKDAVSELVCSSAAVSVYKRLCFKTLNAAQSPVGFYINFLLEKQICPADLFCLGTLLPPCKGQGGSIPFHLMAFADNRKTELQNGRGWRVRDSWQKPNETGFISVCSCLLCHSLILLFLGRALMDGLHFS